MMTKLAGIRTEENLRTAFAGEAMAPCNYNKGKTQQEKIEKERKEHKIT